MAFKHTGISLPRRILLCLFRIGGDVVITACFAILHIHVKTSHATVVCCFTYMIILCSGILLKEQLHLNMFDRNI